MLEVGHDPQVAIGRVPLVHWISSLREASRPGDLQELVNEDRDPKVRIASVLRQLALHDRYANSLVVLIREGHIVYGFGTQGLVAKEPLVLPRRIAL